MLTTVDVAKGRTSPLIKCRSAKECKGHMLTSRYPLERPIPLSTPNITHEWYRPSKKDLDKESKKMIEYVILGGLDLRERTEATPFCHKKKDIEAAN